MVDKPRCGLLSSVAVGREDSVFADVPMVGSAHSQWWLTGTPMLYLPVWRTDTLWRDLALKLHGQSVCE